MQLLNRVGMAVAVLSLMLSGCSSSGGASPASNTGTTSGMTDTGTTDSGGTDSGGTDSGGTDAGASDAGATQPSSVPGAAAVAIMQGNWESECFFEEENLGSPYSKETMSVNGAVIAGELGFYSDDQCMVPQAVGLYGNASTVQFRITTVPTGSTVATPQGDALAVDFFVETITFDNKPIPEEIIRFGGLEYFEYDIVRVDNGTMNFGDINVEGFDGETPETRPQTLDFTFSFMKVQ